VGIGVEVGVLVGRGVLVGLGVYDIPVFELYNAHYLKRGSYVS